MKKSSRQPKRGFQLAKITIMLAAAGFSQGLLAALVPPTLTLANDPSGYALSEPNQAGYGGSIIKLNFTEAPTDSEYVNYTIRYSVNPDMSNSQKSWSGYYQPTPGLYLTSASVPNSPSTIDPEAWSLTPKKLYYQIVATNWETEETVSSNVVQVNLTLPPFFLDKNGKYLPTDMSSSERHLPIYVPPGAGKTKIGSVFVHAPDVAAFKALNPDVLGGKNGTITVENGDVYFNATALFGSGENAAIAEDFTLAYPANDPVSGIDTTFQRAPIHLSIIPSDPNDATPPAFKLFYDGFENTNVSPSGSLGNPIVKFVQNRPEPLEIVKTWSAGKLALVQVGGVPCALFSYSSEAYYYMQRTGSPRACYTENVDSNPAINYFSQKSDGVEWTDMTWRQGLGVNVNLDPQALTGNVTIPIKVQEVNPEGQVLRTHTVTYQNNFVPPDNFTFNVIPSSFSRKVGEFYVVNSYSSPVSDYQILTGNPENAFKRETKPYQDDVNFSTGYLYAYVVDKRDPETEQLSSWSTPSGYKTVSYFVAVKEKIPLSTEKIQNGDLKVNINKSEEALAGYKFTLQRVSSATGTVSVPEDDATFTVHNNNGYSTSNNGQNDDHKTTNLSQRQASVIIKKATLDAVTAAGDFLTIRWDADLSNVPQQLRDDVVLASDYYTGTLSIDGYGATVGVPEGDLSLPQLLWRGDVSNVISIAGKKNITRTDWTITRVKTGAQIVDSKTNGNDYDLSQLSPGEYTVMARLANATGEYIDTPVKSFTIYDRPTATISVPTVVNRGDSGALSAVTYGVTAKAVASWQVGGVTYPATIDIPNARITGDFKPDASFPVGNVKAKLIVHVDPAVEASKVEFVSEGEIAVGDLPGGTISATAKVFWAGKSQKINFEGNGAAKRIDWMVTSPFGQTTTVSKTDLGPLDTGNFVEGTYTIVAKVYNQAGTPTTVEKSYLAKVYKEPKISITAPSGIAAGSNITVKGTYNTLPMTATAKFLIGEQELPGVIDRAKSVISASYTLPTEAPASYPVTLKVVVDSANPDTEVTYTANIIKALAYTPVKVAVSSSPSVLDVGVQGIYKATVKASWDTKALPIQGNGLMGEWELPDGTIVPGLNMVYTPTEADYALISQGRLPLFRGWLDGNKDATMATTTPRSKMYEPWVMPEYSFVLKKGAAVITAPDSAVLVLTPNRVLDPKMASYRAITYKWTLPSGEGVLSQAVRDTLTITANKPGVFPVSVVVSDKHGAEKTANFSFEAVASTFNVDSLSFKTAPESKRVPVMVIPRIATSSSHKKERPSLFEMIVDGNVVASGSQPKPVTISEEGAHEIGVKVTSNFKTVATRTEQFVATPNQAPICPKPFRISFGKIGAVKTVKATAQCKDPDGKIKGYAWTINGQPSNSTTDAQSYQLAEGETSVQMEVTIKDDSGGTFKYSETINAL